MDVAKIRLLVEANSSGVGSGLAPGLQSINRFASDVETSLKRVGSAWSNLGTGEKVLAGFGIAAGAAAIAIASTVKPAIEFESAFAGVRKTVDGTEPQLAAIRQGIINMSKEMPTAAKDLAVIAENAGQLGVKAPDILNFTKVVAQLGETTDLSFDSASTELARFLSITGSGAAAIDPVSNALVALGNAGASTESEIVNFSQRLASAVTVAGGTADQILALASAFSSFGVNAEAGGSALSTIITSISDAARGGNSHLAIYAKTAGLLPEEFAAIAKANPVEALLRFGEGLGEVVRAGGSVTPVMEAVELGGLRTSEVMRLLALNSGSVREALALAAAEMANGTARQDEYDKRQETTAAKLERLKNTITAVQIEVGTQFLAGVANGAEAAAEAVSFLVDVMTPLAGELRELFSNGADLAVAFWDAIGGTAAKTAVAALVGAIVVITNLLDAFNSLGPAGVALAGILATLALYPPAMAAARAATFSFALSLASVGPAGTAAAAGAAALNAALSAGPLILFTAALAATGKSFYDAGKAATAAGNEIEQNFQSALKTQNFENAARQVDILSNRMGELRSQLEGKNVFEKLGIDTGDASTSMSRLGTAITGTAEILSPFTENTVVNAQKELEELQRVAGENGMGLFQQNIEGLAARLGLSTDATIKLASEMGLLEAITTGNLDAFYNASNAMENFVEVAGETATQLNLTKEQAIDSATSIEELSAATGVSVSNLQALASSTDEIDLKKMFEGNPEERMDELQKLANKLRNEIDPLATAIGLTTDEYLSQVTAVKALAAAQDDLAKTIAGTKTALDSVNAQQRASTESANAFQEALKGISSDFSSVETAASAGRQAILDFAGTGAPIEDVTAKQADLARQLYDTATAAGHEKEAVVDVIAELLRVPPSVVSEIIAKGEQAKLEAGIVDGLLKDLTDEEWEALISADPSLAQVRIDMVRQEALAWENSQYDAKLSANPELAIHNTSEAKAQADAFAQAQYDAKLSANPELAIQGASQATAAGNTWAQGSYDGKLTATNTDALNKASESERDANRYARSVYNANLTATNSDALSKSKQASDEANRYGSLRPNATLSATDNASGVIRGAINTLNGFQSRSITLTVRNVTINESVGAGARGNFGLEGMIISPGGARSFAGGGYYGGGASNLVMSYSTGAGFYQSLPGVARVFAEPATAGEWYIPAEGNRSRSRAIWEDAGRKLGFMDRGGGSGVLIHAPVSVAVTAAAGADLQAIGSEVARKVEMELRRLGRQLDNKRMI